MVIPFKRFLGDPLIALNNHQIKLAVMERKNWLFSPSRLGASLVLTTKTNHLNVRKYLIYPLKELP
ncbi:hypothetical protein [Loigolactobacillus backii]|uniref:hypothetical protein n=1 Tax=Loigolactobacillus backii TaxID=375175 RepID=UPI000C1CA22F|nr:hypothetical protein [Loigolactobacillus backii]MDA5387321.1 hypothetical protein [Loigolactobacillus backii]